MAARTSHQGRAYGAEETAELMRDALADLMADGTPVRSISVEKLAAHVGMARSTFYARFGDKVGLLQELSATALKHHYAAQRAWIAKGADVTRDDIREGMRSLLDTYLEDEVVMRAVAEASVYEPAIRDGYVKGVEDYARAVERHIRRGHADVPAPKETALALAWMTERTVSQVAPGTSSRRLDAIAEALAGIVVGALHVRDT